MEKIIIKNIRFLSFLKLAVFAFFPIGLLFGIVAFLLSFLGEGVTTATIGDKVFYGVPAGLISVVLSPAVFVMIGIIAGIIAYLPFRIFTNFFKGVKIYGDFELTDNEEV